MKAKALVMAAIVLVVLAAGCSTVGASPKANDSIEIAGDEFAAANHITRTIDLAPGDAVTVSLASNPSTGFSWTEAALIADPTVLEQVEATWTEAENKGMMGAGGSQVWTLKALRQGTTTVRMEYSRPWEGGEKAVWTFELTVTVK